MVHVGTRQLAQQAQQFFVHQDLACVQAVGAGDAVDHVRHAAQRRKLHHILPDCAGRAGFCKGPGWQQHGLGAAGRRLSGLCGEDAGDRAVHGAARPLQRGPVPHGQPGGPGQRVADGDLLLCGRGAAF